MSNEITRFPVLELERISKTFVQKPDLIIKIARKTGLGIPEQKVLALDDVSLDVYEGEVLGIVGESGCGKSTLGKIVSGLLSPDKGVIRYRGMGINEANSFVTRIACLGIQMIFQNPYSSLNPRMKIRDIIGEAAIVHGFTDKNKVDDYVDSLMIRCGLAPEYKNYYPHQFSGGQCQRIAIARALAVMPDVLICDEVVSALDVSVQAQILNLLTSLREESRLTSVFISHDLRVVEHMSNRIVTMYMGRIVEIAETGDLLKLPAHPYTCKLFEDAPSLNNRNVEFKSIEREIPSAFNPPSGCHFHLRCPKKMDICTQAVPKMISIEPGHKVRCHLFDLPS
ncbi:Oligopeptide/dipeptide ABC transporter, ATP-binding protein [Desulfonema limicola]|uniref:Oligopeptide/dipeptide ABC transporter, ATP-binding protein n=1 Tax=Desulfonema limicola TaxID=45656 RepID=A0A975BCM5_9BACT|nr:ABC transporter ATP-binding protein [Desulfonema limicola]QTA82907.1 Oligopeptide/dipeptide ABC transporter, ATP-binding protein [Desulfonema limicola]